MQEDEELIKKGYTYNTLDLDARFSFSLCFLRKKREMHINYDKPT